MLLQAVRPLAVPVLQNSRSAATRVASLQQLVARWLHRCQRRPPTIFISTPESPDSFPSSCFSLSPRLLVPQTQFLRLWRTARLLWRFGLHWRARRLTAQERSG